MGQIIATYAVAVFLLIGLWEAIVGSTLGALATRAATRAAV